MLLRFGTFKSQPGKEGHDNARKFEIGHKNIKVGIYFLLNFSIFEVNKKFCKLF